MVNVLFLELRENLGVCAEKTVVYRDHQAGCLPDSLDCEAIEDLMNNIRKYALAGR